MSQAGQFSHAAPLLTLDSPLEQSLSRVEESPGEPVQAQTPGLAARVGISRAEVSNMSQCAWDFPR